MRKIICIFAFLLFLLAFYSKNIFAQDEKFIDSLKKELRHSIEDTNKFYILSDIAWEYIGNSPSTSLAYSDQALKLALKLNFRKGVAKSLYNIGLTYYKQGEYVKAIGPSIKAASIFEEIGHKKGLAASYNNLGNIYEELKKHSLAIEYQLKAFKIQEKIKAYTGMCWSLNNIGNIYCDSADYNKALLYYNKALEIAIKQEDATMKARIYNNLGITMKSMNKNDEALEYYLKSVELKKKSAFLQGMSVTFNNIGDLYILKKDYTNAKIYFEESLKMAQESSSKDEIKNAYYGMAAVYAGLKQYENAYTYQKKYVELNDSLYNVESTNYITELQTKYETEKKERNIEKLTGEKEKQSLKLKQNKIIIYSISLGGILLIAIILASFNVYKQKQTRRRMFAKIIETEEKERQHFAEELHDGLGPMLSSVNIYVNELKSDRHDATKKVEFLNYTSELIDEAIKNTRSIANKLMPGTLNDYGLVTAVETFCDKLKKSGNINISVLSDKKDQRYHPAIEITIYRVILEMINNTIKHAQATNITIDIVDNDKMILVKYQDDGKGFDFERIIHDPKKGLGLSNIQNRIKSIGGNCLLESHEDKGMQCLINVNYKNYSS